MKPWLATIVPVTTAAVLGAWVAITVGRPATPPSPRPDVLSARPAMESGSAASSTEPSRAVPDAPATAPAGPEIVPLGPPEAGAGGLASPPRVGPTIVAPTTREALLEDEIACARNRLPEACERAALALETGSAGAHDPVRAPKLRRVALTLYLKQCKKNRVPACARLADMQEYGEVIQKNRANAEALRRRIGALCGANPAREGCSPSVASSVAVANTP